MQKNAVQEAVVIDYPEQNEKVTAPAYTLRIGALAGARKVEVSIDDRAWQPCRPAVGYWWFDWAGYDSGRHEVACRAQLADGRVVEAESREFLVDFKTQPKRATLVSSRQESHR